MRGHDARCRYVLRRVPPWPPDLDRDAVAVLAQQLDIAAAHDGAGELRRPQPQPFRPDVPETAHGREHLGVGQAGVEPSLENGDCFPATRPSPVCRPKKPQVLFASFCYQAESWSKPRRVVARVEWHQGELYLRVDFIVTNLTRPARRIANFYNRRGTAEQWIR